MSVHIVAGGQFGSEGKGAFTAALTNNLRGWVSDPKWADRLPAPPVLVRVAGPNAGHTAYDAQGRKWSLRQIPVGSVVSLDSTIIIGQQSEIDLEVLLEEINALEEAGIPIKERLFIDTQATMIESRHRSQEAGITTGTTGKGIGAARAERLLRRVTRMGDLPLEPNLQGLNVLDTVSVLRAYIGLNTEVIIEGTQGYGLGLHTSYYPHCTSSNTRPGDFLAMAGLQPWECPGMTPWLVFRANPIRIAGNSGPLELETSWEEVGQPTEFTTVTKKPRRVGLWDQKLADEAVRNCGGSRVRVVYMFLDYELPKLHGVTEPTPELCQAVRNLMQRIGYMIHFVGTGPSTGVWRPVEGWGQD